MLVKIVIPGGSGQVGTLLARSFTQQGHAVIVLSREPRPAPWRVAAWDGESLGPWSDTLAGADAVINLAGRSVNCRYTAANREEILQSRVRSTRIVGKAIAAASPPPRVWLQASTATIYAHRFDSPNDEASGIIGGTETDAPSTWRFSVGVARAWEHAVDETSTPGTRRIKMRSAMVMSPDHGGIFDTLLGLVRHGLGGRAGNGRQYVSWIHHRDFERAVRWLVEHDDVEGVINIAAPQPLPNAEFMHLLREAWGISLGLPATNWMLEIGARALGTETELILKSRRVVPGRLIQRGFTFDFPEWAPAAADLCREWRKRRNSQPPP